MPRMVSPRRGGWNSPTEKTACGSAGTPIKPEHAPHPKGGKQLFDDGSHRGGVDGVVGARRCDLPDLLGQWAGLRVDGVGGTELGGQRPPALVQVDRDDRRGLAHHGGHHCGQPHRACAGDDHRRSGLDVE